jgi:drug/metabolite transporter (DMT)-like permease
MKMKDKTKGLLYALTAALFWGLLAIALKMAVTKVDSFTIVWIRFVLAFSGLFVWIYFTDRKQLRILIRPPWQLVVGAVSLAINYIGFMLGVQYTSPSNAQVIIQVGPVLLALCGIFIFKEKINRSQMIGFAVVVLGFFLFYSQQLKSLFIATDNFNKGVLLTLMGAFAWTGYAIMQKLLVKRYSPQTLNLFLFGLPALLYFPTANLHTLTNLSFGWWCLLFFLGANTLLGYGGMSASLKYLDANTVSSIIINNPIITFVLMALFTHFDVTWVEHEHFSFWVWFGAFLFIFGAFIVVRGGKKKVNEQTQNFVEK